MGQDGIPISIGIIIAAAVLGATFVAGMVLMAILLPKHTSVNFKGIRTHTKKEREMGGLAGLGINLPTLLAQIINFAILLGLMYLVAYKPIMRMFDERSRKIKESMEQTEFIKEQAARAEEEAQKRIEQAAKEGQEVIARAVRTGEEVKREAQQEARKEAESLIARARMEIQRERDDAIDELRREFADLTILAASKVIDRSLDKEAHRQLIDKVLEESATLKTG